MEELGRKLKRHPRRRVDDLDAGASVSLPRVRNSAVRCNAVAVRAVLPVVGAAGVSRVSAVMNEICVIAVTRVIGVLGVIGVVGVVGVVRLSGVLAVLVDAAGMIDMTRVAARVADARRYRFNAVRNMGDIPGNAREARCERGGELGREQHHGRVERAAGFVATQACKDVARGVHGAVDSPSL